MAINFYYVRHGQTEFNRERRLQGACDSPLTEKGIADARRAETALRRIPFDHAWCSSSERCVDTAAIVLERHNVSAKPTKNLKEVNFGRLDGHLIDEIKEEFEALKRLDNFESVGGDTPESLSGRIFSALENALAEARDGENILLVSHGAYGMHVLKYVFHLDTEKFKRMRQKIDPNAFAFPNCGIMKFRRNRDAWELLELPCEPERFTDSGQPVEFPFLKG